MISPDWSFLETNGLTMKVLAWDTSSKTGALVALEGDRNVQVPRLVTELTLNVESTHSERLLWGIHQTLESARWKIEDVDIFGVGVGPGSFTGLRIGITTARTLAHTLRKPLVGVSSLAALARPIARFLSHSENSASTHLVAVTDACKGELFSLWGKASAVTRCAVLTQANLWDAGVQEKVLSPQALADALVEDLKKDPLSRWVAVGEGRQRYAQAWDSLPADREIPVSGLYSEFVQGRYLGQLVWEAVQASQTPEDPLEIHPCYLRASDAELKLKAGLLKPGPTRG